MTINKVDTVSNIQLLNTDQISSVLTSIAKAHYTTVDELVEGAVAAGSNGAEYQIRALNLQARLDRLNN